MSAAKNVAIISALCLKKNEFKMFHTARKMSSGMWSSISPLPEDANKNTKPFIVVYRNSFVLIEKDPERDGADICSVPPPCIIHISVTVLLS